MDLSAVYHEYLVGARAEKVSYFSPFKRENIRRSVSAEISSEPSDRSRSFASTERGILIGEKKMSILDINGEGDYVNFLAESISSKRARAREECRPSRCEYPSFVVTSVISETSLYEATGRH